jgi:2'-5' RNA ligase
MSDRWRLFVAVELPDDARAAIVRATDALSLPGLFGRTDVEQLHQTVLFLGAVEPATIPEVEARLAGVAAGAAPFRSALTGFGTFPGRGLARVVWVGLRDDEGDLAWLAAASREALRDLVVTEERAFRAHVTVARAREPVRLPREALDAAVEPVSFDVEELTLFRSHLGGGAPARYEALHRWRLARQRP